MGNNLVQIIAPFEDILENSTFLYYNTHLIEVPGLAIFNRGSSLGSIMTAQLGNPSTRIIPVSEETFSNMIESIEIFTENNFILSFPLKTVPKKDVMLNLFILKRTALFIESDYNSLLVNNTLFTNSTSEFHGTSMFSSKRTYYVSKEILYKIKNTLIKEN